MKKGCFLMLACVALGALSFVSCSNDEEPLQNLVIVSQKYHDAEVRNGDIIALDYYSEFSANVDIVIKDGDNKTVYQHETVAISRGDGVLSIKLDVGRNYGRAIVYLTYPNLLEHKLLSEAERAVTERFFINILKVEDEPRPDDEIN